VTANKNIHLQSERNARRRKHRELLRQVRLRKDATATAEEKSVVIYGLGEDISEKQLYKKIKKVGPLVKVEINVNAAGKRFATAQFKAISFVEIAHKKLDNHTFKGSKMKVRKLASSSKTSSEKEGLRLIIRNLSFEVDDAALEKVFTEYGPLYEAQVVRMPVGDGYVDSDGQLPLGRSRGFGFVQFRDVDDARVAVEVSNVLHLLRLWIM
jgi:RNA recognition motif-containing protein